MTTILIGGDKPKLTVTADGQPGRRIEWLGELSPMDDPFLWTGIAINRFTPEMVKTIRRAALRRTVKTRDAWRSLSPRDTSGVSREIVWNRTNRWIVVLSYADADKVLGCIDGHEFRDLDATDADDPGILLPPRDVQPGSAVLLKEITREVMRANGDTRIEQVS